jgi:4-hydroxybenzoate polyprenyltransferase
MSLQVRVAPVWSGCFWRAYWVTLRPYLFFVSGVSGLVGLALVDGAPKARVALALGAFFLAYGLGQALTDTTQLDTDSISSPYRPLVRGTVGVRTVRVVSVAGLAGCALVFAWLSPWTIVLSLAAVSGLATYTPLKRRWWGGPVWNSWIVALLPVMGALCAGASLDALVADARALLCAASVFCSYAVFVLLGYLKDVAADRATGYCTLPVRFGRRVTVVASAVFCLVALLASALLVTSSLGADASPLALGTGILLWCVAVVWLLLAHARLFFVASDNEAHSGIGAAVRGYVALHAAEAALLQPALAMVAALLVVLFELALACRPCREQI